MYTYKYSIVWFYHIYTIWAGGLSCNCLGTPTSLTGALCQEPQEWLKSVKKGHAFFGLGLDLSSQQLVAVTVFMQL